MTSYSVTIDIDPYWVNIFNTGKYKLVMAKGVGDASASVIYNVVATTGTVTPTMNISWTDQYQLLGSTQAFTNGVKIQGTSTPIGVKFQQKYVLKSWNNATVVNDPSIPVNSLGFENSIVCSSVLNLSVGGSGDTPTPVYVSPNPLPPGKQTLTPKPLVCFWFQQNLETATMITLDMSTVYEVNLTGSPTATIKYDANGVWSTISSPMSVDYTKKLAAKPPQKTSENGSNGAKDGSAHKIEQVQKGVVA